MNIDEALSLSPEQIRHLPSAEKRSLLKESYTLIAEEQDIDLLIDMATDMAMTIHESIEKKTAAIPKFEYADVVMEPSDDESFDAEALRMVDETMDVFADNPEALRRVFRQVFVHARQQCRELKAQVITLEAYVKVLEQIIREK